MMEKSKYKDYIKKEMPKTKHLKTILGAFVIGGIICCIGQGITDLLKLAMPEAEKEIVQSFTTLILIAITGILTGFGVYDKVGKVGGAGSIVPITGFANSIVSPAIEHKREGVVLGLCTNMFKLAGPVIVFGITASVVVGIIYYVIGLF